MRLPFNIQPKRTKLQAKALETAKAIYNSDPEKYRNTMFCPYCGQPLIKSGVKSKMETLSEHVTCSEVSEKDEYICSANKPYNGQYLYNCDDERIGCKFGILHVWNGTVDVGGSYISEFYRTLLKEIKKSILKRIVFKEWLAEDQEHKHSEALNTFNCEAETSIYNIGLTNMIRIPAWLTLNIIQLTLDFKYKANSFGEVTDTYVSIGFLKRNKGSKYFNVRGIWFFNTWIFLNKSTKVYLNAANATSNEKNKIRCIAKALNRPMNDSWIYRLYEWYAHLRHPKYSKMLKKAGKYKVVTW